MKQIKLIVSDLDGTLLNSQGKLSPETIKALHKTHKKGYRIVFASGRGDAGILKVINEAGLNNDISHVISFNGSKITRLKDGVNTHNFFTESSLLLKVSSLVEDFNESELINRRLPHLTTYGVNNKTIYTNYNCFYSKDEASKNNLELKNFDSDVNTYKVVVAGDSQSLDIIIDKLRQVYGKEYNILRSADTNIDIVHNKSGKKAACKFLLNEFNLSCENLMTFGDSGNDSDMLSFAKIGVAMGNASTEAKVASNYVTLSNDEHGVAYFLDKL